MIKEYRTPDVDVTNSRKAMTTISLNAKFKNLVTNVELSQATLLIFAQQKMSLAVHVRRRPLRKSLQIFQMSSKY